METLPLSRTGKTAHEVAVRAIEETGDIVVRCFSGERTIEWKPGRANIVTDADLLAEKTIIGILQNEYPDWAILSEESGASGTDSRYTWVIDPIDGTSNYTFGIPLFCIALALMDGETCVLGLTYDPIRKELFHAEQGKGAFMNHTPIKVSQRDSVLSTFIGCDLGYDSNAGRKSLDVIDKLWPDIHGIRIMGSAALGLAYVACGRFDIYFHSFLYSWDCAGGILLVTEAGGKVTGWNGVAATFKNDKIVATNKAVHKEFMGFL